MLKVQTGKKLYNFRLLSALAFALIAGIVFGAITAYFAVGWAFLLLPSIVAAAALIVCTFLFKNINSTVCLAFIAAIFMLGALCSYFYCVSFAIAEVPNGEAIFIEGRVDKVGITSGGSKYLVISNATAQGKKINGRIIAYLAEGAGNYCERGYKVTFYTALYKQTLFENGEITYYAQNSIKYYCTVHGGMKSAWGFSLFGAANGAVRDALFDNLDGETAAVCYALLTGDSSLISQGTLASFRGGGIAHLFAVSGLHIGVIFGALTLLFKKLPINRYVSAAVRIGAVFVYAGVCNFTPSSVRATVMCAVMLCASLFYKKNDSLNALSLAAVIVLLINPMSLFGAGFLLSFGGALAIIMLSRNCEYVLRFLPERFKKLLSAGLSVQFATIPVQFACFSYISWAGLFLNVLIIPVVSILYLLILFVTLLAAAIPAAGSLVAFASLPVQLLINGVVECGLENAVIMRSVGLWIFAPFALLLIALSDKFNLTRLWRCALSSVAAIALTLGFIVF